MNEAENYVLSLLLDINLWVGTTSFCNQDSQSAGPGPVFGEASCSLSEDHNHMHLTSCALRTWWQITDVRDR